MEKKQKIIILFLDTGDNCRCPMVKGYLQKLLDDRGIKHIDIRTAGVMTPSDLKPQDEAKQILAEEGVSIERHRSRPVSAAMIREADLILGMTPFHVQKALRESDEARQKTHLLKEYVGYDGKHTLIVDPMGGTLEVFKKVFSEIRSSLLKLVNMDIIQKTRPAPPPPAPRAAAAPPVEKPQAPATAPSAKASPSVSAKKTAPAKPVAKPAVAKKAETQKAAKAKPAPKAAPVKAKVAPKAAPKKAAKPVAKAPVKPAPKPKPAAKKATKPAGKKPVAKAKAAPARPAAKPAAKKSTPKAAPKAAAKVKPATKAKPVAKAKSTPVKKGKK